MSAVNRLAVIGLGLIGGSTALAARANAAAEEIVAWDTKSDALRQALKVKAIDRAASSPADACRGADLIVLAVPVMSIVSLGRKVKKAASPNAVITDVGSTKASIVASLERLPGAQFVGGHPIAGTENSGFASARWDLFSNTPFILTPTKATSARAADLVESLWRALGCRVQRLTPAEHDRLFALISHLPHLAAYALVSSVFQGVGKASSIAAFAGGGFRDYTRIGGSDPVMWRDICLDNRRYLLPALTLFQNELAAMRRALKSGLGKDLQRTFNRARRLKRSL